MPVRTCGARSSVDGVDQRDAREPERVKRDPIAIRAIRSRVTSAKPVHVSFVPADCEREAKNTPKIPMRWDGDGDQPIYTLQPIQYSLSHSTTPDGELIIEYRRIARRALRSDT